MYRFNHVPFIDTLYKGLFRSFCFAEDGAGGSGDGQSKADKSDGSKNTDYSKINIDDIPEGIRQELINKGIGIENQKFSKKFESKLAEQGIDVEEYKKFQTEKAELENKRLKDAGEFDKIKDQMNADWQTKVDAEKATNANMLAALRKHLVNGEIAVAASKYEAHNSGQIVDLMHQQFSLEYSKEKGKYFAVHLQDGTVQVNAEGNPKTIDDVIKAYLAKEENANLVKSKVGQGGSGSNGNGNINFPKGPGGANMTSEQNILAGLNNRKTATEKLE